MDKIQIKAVIFLCESSLNHETSCRLEFVVLLCLSNRLQTQMPLSPPLLNLLIPQVTDRPQEEEVGSKARGLGGKARELGGKAREMGGEAREVGGLCGGQDGQPPLHIQ